jgi:outer membrane protein assembly factor BamB
MKEMIRIKNLNRFAMPLLTILCALSIVLGAPAPMAAASANWAQTYYNGAHTGYNLSEKSLGVSNVSSLQLLWAASVAGGVTNFAVDGGVVYATGQANNLVALNASTGAQLWSANNGGNGGYSGSGAIAVGGGLVFAQCEFTDGPGGTPYGAICAYKAKTGKMVWQFSAPCNCLPESSVQSPLVLANGILYFGYAYGGSNGYHAIYALKANTGAVLWSYGSNSNGFGSGPAAVAGSSVYFGGGEHAQIIALSTSNGALQWATSVSPNDDPVAVSGGVVYVSSYWTGSDATLSALKATTGAILWSYTYGTENWCGGGEAPSPPAIAKGVVYFQGVDGYLYALKAKKGTLIWAESSGDCYPVSSSPSIANGVVYISGGGASTGFASNTTAYSAATGALLWGSSSPHGTLYTPPVVVNGILYFASPGDSICQSICAYSVP